MTLENAQNNILYAHIERVTKAQTDIYCTCVVLMDGTFKFCPKHFYQLYTSLVYVNLHYIPVVYALLIDKHKETYVKLLTIISDKCRDMSLLFNPKTITDFQIESLH